MELNRYFDYDFDEDTESQADEIVHEAKDKLVDLIYENVKSEIEEDKKNYERAKERADELQKECYEKREKIDALEIELKKVKEELERSDKLIPKTPLLLVMKFGFLLESVVIKDWLNALHVMAKGILSHKMMFMERLNVSARTVIMSGEKQKRNMINILWNADTSNQLIFLQIKQKKLDLTTELLKTKTISVLKITIM